jgi:hypothetical protein
MDTTSNKNAVNKQPKANKQQRNNHCATHLQCGIYYTPIKHKQQTQHLNQYNESRIKHLAQTHLNQYRINYPNCHEAKLKRVNKQRMNLSTSHQLKQMDKHRGTFIQ